MANYTIKGTITGKNIKSLQKLVENTFPGQGVLVNKIEPPKSRADRLAEAESLVEDAKSTVEELKDELQSWFDNLPENFQQGDKGSQLEEAISNLETLYDSLEELDFSSVDFPSMMG